MRLEISWGNPRRFKSCWCRNFLFFNYNINFYYIKLISINYYQKYNNRTLLYKLSFDKSFANITNKANKATNSYIFIPSLQKKQINE